MDTIRQKTTKRDLDLRCEKRMNCNKGHTRKKGNIFKDRAFRELSEDLSNLLQTIQAAIFACVAKFTQIYCDNNNDHWILLENVLGYLDKIKHLKIVNRS